MAVSFVLRLVSEALERQTIAGRIEAIQTGEQATVRTADELMAFLYKHAAPQVDAASPPAQGSPIDVDG